MNKPKPIVGQKLYSLNVGNAARGRAQFLTEVEVIKVGRKYFSCKEVGGWQDFEYRLSDWGQKTNFSATSFLYEK